MSETYTIKIIHHGGAIKERRLELMIAMMKYLDPNKYSLSFMLVNTNSRYFDYLVRKSRLYKNINFIDPVDVNCIPQKINEFDIGVFLIETKNFNYKYALPNKLFEFVQARLAIAIGPSIEMAKIVNKYNLGVVADQFTPKSLAKAIMSINPEQLTVFKNNADKHARELSAEGNIAKIQEIVANLAGV